MKFPLPHFDRPAYRAEKEDIQAEYGLTAVYRMSFNESPLGPSPKVVAAIQEEAVRLGDYPPMSDTRLREALAETLGRGLTPDHFYTGCSGYETLELTARALLQPGDEIIVCPPMFGVYIKIAALQGATAVKVPLKPHTFIPDVDAILAAITEKTRFIIICNPNNPTGTVMPKADMDRLVDSLPDHVVIVADEVYSHYVTNKEYPDSIRYVLDNKPVVIIQTFSKAYGLAGLRLGFAIAPPEIANYIGGLHRGFHHNRLALVAGITALADQAHLRKNVAVSHEGKEYLYEQFDRLDLPYIPSDTNFIVVRLNRDSKEVAKALLKFGVIVRPLHEPGLENCLRVTTAVSEGNQLFIESLEKVLSEK